MGIEGLNSIRIYGSGANFTVGQNNNANGPWPRTNLNDFNRWIDFTQPATRATATTWAVPVQGGAAAAGAVQPVRRAGQPRVGPASRDLDHAVGLPQGRAGQRRDARRTRPSTARDYKVLTWSPPQKSPGGQPYKVVGYIGDDNLVHWVETWVENADPRRPAGRDRVQQLPRPQRPQVPEHDRAEAAPAGRPSRRSCSASQANPADIAERAVAPPPPPHFPAPPPPAPGAAPPPASEQLAAGRVAHPRRLQRARGRVRRPRRAVRARPAERGPRARRSSPRPSG